MKKNKNDIIPEQTTDENANAPDGKRTAFYCALVAVIISAVALVLAFVPMPFSGGVYFLIASALSSLACAAFLNTKKRHSYFTACKVVRICAYVLFALVMLTFLGAAIYSGIK